MKFEMNDFRIPHMQAERLPQRQHMDLLDRLRRREP